MLRKLKRILYRSMNSKEIDYKTAKQMTEKDPNSIFLDIRSKQEYDEGHIPGSVFLYLYDLDKHAGSILKDKTQLIICYCSSGSRSKEAQKKLEKMGYQNVYSLKGGLDAIED